MNGSESSAPSERVRATAALETGADVRTLADLIGHGSTRITPDVYPHVSDERKRDVAERVAKGLVEA